MSSSVTKEAVLTALGKVYDPELNKDLVSLGMIQNVAISDGKVSFELILTTPACPLREQIEADARKAVLALPGVKSVDIKMSAAIRSAARSQELLKLPIRNIVAIASGKGGVGKTTVAVNIAIALAQTGATVGLLDADIYGPNVPTMMGVNQLPPPEGDKLVPAEAYGVKVMSVGFLVEPGQPLIWRGPMLHGIIRQFLGDVLWDELDYLIIDLPPGTGDAQISLAQSVGLTGGIIVTLPQSVSLEDASRGLEMFRRMNIPVLGVVENMSYLEMPDGTHMDIFGNGGGEILAERYCVPFLGGIPMDPYIRVGGDEGKPVIVVSPESNSAKALRKIAEAVAAQLSILAIGDK